MKKKLVWTLEDAAHFIIFRELDKLRVPFPYEKASKICDELRAAVTYRAPRKI
jgi:hypothetical protein